MTAPYERIPVARPPDDNAGSVRARAPHQVEAMRDMRAGGGSIQAIAEAYGVSVRTAYRYLAAPEETYLVDVDGWSAAFAVRPGGRPRRVSPWQRRAES